MRKLFFTLLAALIGIAHTNAQNEYHPDDLQGLRDFLRQNSAEPGKTNAEQLGLAIADMDNWQNNEILVEKIEGLTCFSRIIYANQGLN